MYQKVYTSDWLSWSAIRRSQGCRANYSFNSIIQISRNANAIQNGKPGFPIYLKGFWLPFHCNRLPGVKQVKPSTSDSLYEAIFLLLGTVPSVASDARLPPRLPLPLALL